MAAWPATLPAPMLEGYRMEPADQTLRTDMEVGTARVRRRSAARKDEVDAVWRFSDAQMAAFRAWFEDAATGIAGGAAWFEVSLPIGDTGVTSCEARFIGAYKAQLKPGLCWAVSGKLEVRGA